MSPLRIGTGGAVVGAGVLATCTCFTTGVALGGLALAGVPLSLHAALVVAAAALVLGGLAGRSLPAFARAAGGLLLFGAGYLLVPPPAAVPEAGYTAAQLAGFALTLAGVAGVAWAFVTAFPTRRPGAAACAAGGLGAAAGCSCCTSAGALYGFAVAVGIGPFSGIVPREYLPHFLFIGIACAGLYRLAGARLALTAFLAAVLGFTSPRILRLLIDWEMSPVPGRITELAGTAVVMWAFARGFAVARRPAASAAPAVEREAAERPELAGA